MGFNVAGLPYGAPRAPLSGTLAGGPRQPPKGALNLNRVLRPHSPKMDRGGPLLGIMRMLAARKGKVGAPKGGPSAPKLATE